MGERSFHDSICLFGGKMPTPPKPFQIMKMHSGGLCSRSSQINGGFAIERTAGRVAPRSNLGPRFALVRFIENELVFRPALRTFDHRASKGSSLSIRPL